MEISKKKIGSDLITAIWMLYLILRNLPDMGLSECQISPEYGTIDSISYLITLTVTETEDGNQKY